MSVDTTSLKGAKIENANSSLSNFAISLQDGRGISLAAATDEDEVNTDASIDGKRFAVLNEAVCKDWSWIKGSVITEVSASGKLFRLKLDPAGPLNVSVAVWQGSPFLSFTPFRAPA